MTVVTYEDKMNYLEDLRKRVKFLNESCKNCMSDEELARTIDIIECIMEDVRDLGKALEKLEEYETILKTPIKQLREELKLLEILKEFLSDGNTGTGWIEININPNHDILDSEEHKKKQLLIKEWLDE